MYSTLAHRVKKRGLPFRVDSNDWLVAGALGQSKSVPFQNLPRLHHELEQAGWVTDSIQYPSYRALWRALASGAPKS